MASQTSLYTTDLQAGQVNRGHRSPRAACHHRQIAHHSATQLLREPTMGHTEVPLEIAAGFGRGTNESVRRVVCAWVTRCVEKGEGGGCTAAGRTCSPDNILGEVEGGCLGPHIGLSEIILHHEEGQVTAHLGAGRHLHNISEQGIGLGIRLRAHVTRRLSVHIFV